MPERLNRRKEWLQLAAAVLIFASVLILWILFAGLRSDYRGLRDNQVRGRNERITYQNEERSLQCRILGVHGRNDPICAVPPSTTVPLP